MWEWKIFSRMSTIRNMSSSLTLSTLPKLPMEIVKYILSMIRRIQIWEERLYANYKHMFLNVVMNEFKYKLVLQTINYLRCEEIESLRVVYSGEGWQYRGELPIVKIIIDPSINSINSGWRDPYIMNDNSEDGSDSGESGSITSI